MTEVDEIIEFIIENGEGRYDRLKYEDMKRAIEGHLKYGTAMIIRDEKDFKIVAVARWNWVGKSVVNVLDVVVRKDCRNFRFLKAMLALGVRKNPQCRYITFTRSKHPEREARLYNIKSILKGGQ